jgi:hypothetical protein
MSAILEASAIVIVSYVRRFAVYAVAENWKDLPEILPVLIDLARSDPAEDVREAAAGSVAGRRTPTHFALRVNSFSPTQMKGYWLSWLVN